ncbi:MAG: hypothetical protein P8X63_00850 [Desulfuromonadaceae bacterium]
MIVHQAGATTIDHAIEEVFNYFHADGSKRTESGRSKRFEEARRVIASAPEKVIGRVADEFNSLNFQRKAAAYRLVIGLGIEGIEALRARLKTAPEIERLWLLSILHYFRDFSQTQLMAELAGRKNCYSGHLAALALVFQGRQQNIGRDNLILTLISALVSERKIEESAFFVADSALGCLRLLTGESFCEAPPSSVHFYNFDPFLFLPPIHPFPYTADRVNMLSQRQRRQLAERILAWWEISRAKITLKPLVSCFDQ